MTSLAIKINKSSWQVNIGNCDDNIDYLNSEIRINSNREDRHKRLKYMLTKAIHLEYEDEVAEPEDMAIMNTVDQIIGIVGIEI